MYLTLNGSDNCTAIAPRPCNGLPMLRRGLEVVGLIIIINACTLHICIFRINELMKISIYTTHYTHILCIFRRGARVHRRGRLHHGTMANYLEK